MTGQRIGYVLGTTSGGTGRHAAMLAAGCLRDGLRVSVFGPRETRQLFAAAASGSGPGPGGQRRSDSGVGQPSGGQPGGAGSGGAQLGGDGQGRGEEADWSAVVFEPVRITDRPRPVGDIAAVLRLRRLLRQADLDVVHAHGLRAGALAALALRPSSAIRLLGIGPPDAAGPGDKRLGVLRPGTRPPRARQVGGGRPALLVTVHNAPPDTRRAAAVYARLERLVGGEADAVLGVSADLCARMRRLGAHEVRAAVVAAPAAAQPGPADLPDLRAGGRPVVLAAGRLARQKGFGVLIEAAACWRDRRPEPVILIAGDGPLAAELAGLARDVGVDARLLGVRHDVPALLAAADVFVLPSNWEGQPLVLQEALRAGRPIVAADVGGIPALTGPDAALLVPPGDAAALAEAVLAVLDDRELAGRLAKAALERAGRLPSESDAVSAARAEYDRLTPSPR